MRQAEGRPATGASRGLVSSRAARVSSSSAGAISPEQLGQTYGSSVTTASTTFCPQRLQETPTP